MRRAGRLLLSLSVLACAGVPAGAEAAPLSWTPPSAVPGAPLYDAVDCPTESLCVAVGEARSGGSVIAVTTTPADPASWAPDVTNSGSGYGDVDCPSADFCIATRGTVVAVSTDPASGVFTESPSLGRDIGSRIACAGSGLCVANGYSDINWRNTYGVAPFTAGGNWTAVPNPPANPTSFADLACVGAACLAVSGFGIHSTAALSVGGAFAQSRFPSESAPWLQPSAITCVPSTCMLVTDGSGFPNPPDGGVYVSTDRTTWTRSLLPDPKLPADLACAERTGAVRCVVGTLAPRGAITDTRSVADTTSASATQASDWSVLPALFGDTTGGSDNVQTLGCASPYACVAFSFDGRVSVGTAPDPLLGAGGPGGGTPAPGGGGNPPAAPVPPGRPAVRLSSAATTLDRRGRAIFAIQGSPGDRYVANLTTAVPAASVRSAAKKVTIRLGSAKGRFDRRGRARVTITLSAKGRTALKRLGRLSARLRIASGPQGGPQSSRTFTVNVKRRGR
jgi:hypothetical protein